ncbi:hypothetical protein Tco_1126477, partial [Tanacetum coccineum]
MGIEDRNIEKSEVKWSKMESANEHMNKLPGPAEEEKHLIKDNVVKDATRVDLPLYSNEPIWSQQEYFEDLGINSINKKDSTKLDPSSLVLNPFRNHVPGTQ